MLSAEKDIKKLLELIINSCMELSLSDAGTIYIVIDTQTNEWSTYEKNDKNKLLKFEIAKNNSIKLNLESTITEISENSIFGYAVRTGQPLRIDNAYNIPKDAGYQFNDRFDKMLGYRTESILTVPMKDHQDRVLGVIQLINKKVSGKIIPFSPKDEMAIYSLAGQAAVALENNILYKNMEDLLEQYRQIVSGEIIKRKKADEEINKLLNAIEHSPVTVMITDINGHIEYVNPKFTQLTGYTYKEIIGKKPNILKSGKHSAEFYKRFWDTIISGKEWYGEFNNKKKNGELYWESVSVSSLKDENNSIKYFIAIREDITEKKLIAKKLEEKNAELQKTIKKLNEVQSQLIQKEKMASIGQLAAGVAHEINNPLGYVMSNFETLQKYVTKFKELLLMYKDFIDNHMSFTAEDIKGKIEYINQYIAKNKIDFLIDDLFELVKDSGEGLDRVKNIVNALRIFSHVDQLSDFSEYDLNTGIKTTLQIVKNKIKYSTRVHEDYGEIPVIMASGGEINQVILNLILNAEYAVRAKKSSEEGVIEIKTYHKEKYVYFEVSDNGTGIKEEDFDKIFEPFYTTKPVGEGTGLGLSLSYDIIVKKHKGDISVTSKPGAGTKFIVKLPVEQYKSSD